MRESTLTRLDDQAGPEETPRLSILMPVWNEGVVAGPTLRIIPSLVDFPHEMLVVHDFAEDDTVPVARELQARIPQLRLVHNTLGPGAGNAIRAGIAAARAPSVLIFTVDDFGPALAIPEVVALLEQGCDLVSGSRYAYGGRRVGGSTVQKLISGTGNRVFHWLSGSVLSDSTTAFKAFRLSMLEDMELESTGWELIYELTIKAQLKGLRFGEVPITSIDRLYGGTSSFALLPWMRRYLRWFLWGMRELRRPDAPRCEVVVRTAAGNTAAGGG